MKMARSITLRAPGEPEEIMELVRLRVTEWGPDGRPVRADIVPLTEPVELQHDRTGGGLVAYIDPTVRDPRKSRA